MEYLSRASNQRTEKGYEEKRAFRRMLIDAELECWIDEQDTKPGFLRNLSAEGISFYSKESYSIQTQLKIKINTAHEKFHALFAEIEVLSVEEHATMGYLFRGKIKQLF